MNGRTCLSSCFWIFKTLVVLLMQYKTAKTLGCGFISHRKTLQSVWNVTYYIEMILGEGHMSVLCPRNVIWKLGGGWRL